MKTLYVIGGVATVIGVAAFLLTRKDETTTTVQDAPPGGAGTPVVHYEEAPGVPDVHHQYNPLPGNFTLADNFNPNINSLY